MSRFISPRYYHTRSLSILLDTSYDCFEQLQASHKLPISSLQPQWQQHYLLETTWRKEGTLRMKILPRAGSCLSAKNHPRCWSSPLELTLLLNECWPALMIPTPAPTKKNPNRWGSSTALLSSRFIWSIYLKRKHNKKTCWLISVNYAAIYRVDWKLGRTQHCISSLKPSQALSHYQFSSF